MLGSRLRRYIGIITSVPLGIVTSAPSTPASLIVTSVVAYRVTHGIIAYSRRHSCNTWCKYLSPVISSADMSIRSPSCSNISLRSFSCTSWCSARRRHTYAEKYAVVSCPADIIVTVWSIISISLILASIMAVMQSSGYACPDCISLRRSSTMGSKSFHSSVRTDLAVLTYGMKSYCGMLNIIIFPIAQLPSDTILQISFSRGRSFR
mmetsp:Transcript_11627/g.17648  ORF Transcript_11627/g.17648 Transcript_11627/m.17648 type:complete len:207 (-) Transcript_11627:630-1250(-)